jgi:hypothetical protein
MLKHVTTIAGLAAFALIIGAAPALADGWGHTDCSQSANPGCELRAGTGGSNGGNLGGVSPGRHGSSGNGNSGSTDPSGGGGDRIIGEGANLAQCQYQLSDYQWPPPNSGPRPAAFVLPPESGAVSVEPAVFHPQGGPVMAQFAMVSLPLADAPGPSGAWYVYQCTGSGLRDGLYRPPVWMLNGPGASPSPAELAQQARSQLRLPAPKIKASPGGDQLVNLPTWLWLDRGSWGPVSATAAVPGVSVTAVAAATSMTWSMGDGGSVTCTGPGTPFPSGGDPRSASPVCGYTYHTSSAGRPGEAFPVTATVNWTVRWSGAGQGGTFPNLSTSATVPFRVAESEAITTR